jgi:hypothetical protein
MLLIDNNQIILANIFQASKDGSPLNEDYIRHTVLNTYRKYRTKFRQYGDMILCNDGNNYCRKDIFPYYKANRKKQQESKKDEWKAVFEVLDTLREEIKEIFPYPSIRLLGAEADDVIYTLCKTYSQTEKILIVSNDKDFQQLQIFPNVEQYSPTTDKYLMCDNPREFLFEHIIGGDSSDGVPNILSDDDTFIEDGKRQTPLTQKRILQLKKDAENSEFYENPKYIRNSTLIDMSNVPQDLQDRILETYENQKGKGRDKLLQYFIDHKLKTLMPHLEEF